MFEDILGYWQSFYGRIRETLKMWTKPATALLFASALSDINRSRTDLIIENAMLRQQLIVLNRQVKRPQLNQRDRITPGFTSSLHQILATNPSHRPARHIITLAPRAVSPVLATQVKEEKATYFT